MLVVAVGLHVGFAAVRDRTCDANESQQMAAGVTERDAQRTETSDGVGDRLKREEKRDEEWILSPTNAKPRTKEK
jgi:hypothetical protein